jgi:cytochrome c556
LQQAVQAAPATCEALAAAIQPVGETCKSCHQQYR